jgi:hydroxymethylpyrimidine/phosphomethylpyrimidine kinase
MSRTRPVVLSIAGFDPSGGAGLLADVKTLENNKVYALGIVSALTVQNDVEFKKVEWISLDKIIEQVELLQPRYKIECIKIGLIESLEVLHKLIVNLKSQIPSAKIIWDPILKASAGFEFHQQIQQELFEKICKELYLITPNFEEATRLGKSKDAFENAKHISQYCNVFLKGGHNEAKKGYDYLYTKEGKQFSFKPKVKEVFEKHGSGCVVSSAITAGLANDFKIHRSCLRAKEYTTQFLMSNKTLSGYHRH